MPYLSFHRPNLARLAALEKLEASTGVTVDKHAGLSAPAQRVRLESTTSSRFFPGGWFSSTTKLAEENRTSLEMATGEFAKSPTDSVAPSPAVEAPPGTPVDGNVDDKKKGKWCVIM